jgi:hypothetical protein
MVIMSAGSAVGCQNAQSPAGSSAAAAMNSQDVVGGGAAAAEPCSVDISQVPGLRDHLDSRDSGRPALRPEDPDGQLALKSAEDVRSSDFPPCGPDLVQQLVKHISRERGGSAGGQEVLVGQSVPDQIWIKLPRQGDREGGVILWTNSQPLPRGARFYEIPNPPKYR